MSKIFFEQMQIPKPDIFLEIDGDYHSEKVGKMFSTLSEVFRDNKFDGCVLFGDVNSTLAGAIAAVKSDCPIFHVESGLRSHDKRMPEETNRVIVDHLASLLFTTEESGNENLLKEGVDEKKIKFVGNIMIENLELFSEQIDESKIIESLPIEQGKYLLATIHRQENTDHIPTFEKILKILNELNDEYPVILPLHPGTREKIEKNGFKSYLEKMHVIEPLGYFDFLKLVKNSKGVVTDSGGIQEETSHLGVACCTVRDNTERPITLEKGTNKLFPIAELNSQNMLDHINRKDFSAGNIPLWDDQVSKRIFDALE